MIYTGSAKRDNRAPVKGLGTGADDYITKPFQPDELELRTDNLLHRTPEKN
jgi:DNA-binding response OmpR family regulator